MTATMCRKCGANSPACANLCLPCWKDQTEADKEKRRAEERQQRRGRHRPREGHPWRASFGEKREP